MVPARVEEDVLAEGMGADEIIGRRLSRRAWCSKTSTGNLALAFCLFRLRLPAAPAAAAAAAAAATSRRCKRISRVAPEPTHLHTKHIDASSVRYYQPILGFPTGISQTLDYDVGDWFRSSKDNPLHRPPDSEPYAIHAFLHHTARKGPWRSDVHPNTTSLVLYFSTPDRPSHQSTEDNGSADIFNGYRSAGLGTALPKSKGSKGNKRENVGITRPGKVIRIFPYRKFCSEAPKGVLVFEARGQLVDQRIRNTRNRISKPLSKSCTLAQIDVDLKISDTGNVARTLHGLTFVKV
ncbi:hypothetical protein B7494_g7414 [Chlorociboria aeruginascens]|nr:hypothetical protein B7494_g7414 [Chlorociboria aeruginascens]